MTEATILTLPSGATVTVLSSAPTARGPTEASTGDKAVSTWADGAKLVAEVGEEVVSALKHAFRGVEEVTVEFGASISGKTGVILVEGSASANLKVVVKWKAPKDAPNAAA